MGLLDFLKNNDPSDLIATRAENTYLKGRLDDAEYRIEDLEESLLEVSDAFDNVGWSPMDTEQVNEMPLSSVKKIADVARAVIAVNPFVKRGVEARIAYIWGNGVEFEKLNPETEKAIAKNRKHLFSSQAYAERERALASDGNLFTALHRDDRTSFRIPLAQIMGSISNPENTEEIWFYKRQWKTKTKNANTEVEKDEENTKYYPSLSYARQLEDQGKSLPKRWGKYGVDQRYVIQHDTVNKQIGWRWGVPDVTAVLFLAKAYKEYLEDNITLVKAYSRIAMHIQAANKGTANAASAQWTNTPLRDPVTGEMSSTGGTLITGRDTEVNATGLNATQVDFSKGSALAAGIAAGLEVSLDVILSSSANSGQGSTLDLPTLRAMEFRQQLWTTSFTELFEFWDDPDVKVTWRDIDEDETHRRIQSVQLAYDGGQLHQEESRKETLELLRIVPTSDAMPIAPAIKAAQVAAETAQKVAESTPTVVPGQGQSGSVGSVNSGRGQVKAAVKKSMANR